MAEAIGIGMTASQSDADRFTGSLVQDAAALMTSALRRRRAALAKTLSTACGGKPLLCRAGRPPSRNYPDNVYEFRASSHFLYLAGLPLEGAALLLDGDRSTLFVHRTTEADALWHGESASPDALRQATGVDAVRYLDELQAFCQRLPPPLELPLRGSVADSPELEALVDAMIELRLRHDEHAISEIRRAAAVTVRAHRAGMAATSPGVRVSVVRAAMEREILAENFTTAYGSIVTTHGEVLHTLDRSSVCGLNDLLLADVGAESDLGFASDVTRTWPTSGRFSASQRAMYDLVLAAQTTAIAAVRPGVRYRDVHLAACRVLLRGLIDHGLFVGELDGLIERGAHALFFPHGIGHLLGLDVHDMEDFGDRAGYAPGRTRASQFGLCYLRLDRDLAPGNAVTIEPGLYFVPAILRSDRLVAPLRGDFRPDKLAQFADVRGIRIEDDVLVTATGHEVLTAGLGKGAAEVEAMCGNSSSAC
jgi:Xaa-Pro aminopeptidase